MLAVFIDPLAPSPSAFAVNEHGAASTFDCHEIDWREIWPAITGSESFAVFRSTDGYAALERVLCSVAETTPIFLAMPAVANPVKRMWIRELARQNQRLVEFVWREMAIAAAGAHCLVHNGGVTVFNGCEVENILFVHTMRPAPLEPCELLVPSLCPTWGELLAFDDFAQQDSDEVVAAQLQKHLNVDSDTRIYCEDSALARYLARICGFEQPEALEQDIGFLLAESMAATIGGGDGTIITTATARRYGISVDDGEVQEFCGEGMPLPASHLRCFFPLGRGLRRHVFTLWSASHQGWHKIRDYELVARSKAPIELELLIATSGVPRMLAFDMARQDHVELLPIRTDFITRPSSNA